MLFKTTRSLFRGKYQYKIVLVCSGASVFRNIEDALDKLTKVVINGKHTLRTIKTQDDLDYARKVANALSGQTEFDVRVESPWISIYTNDRKLVNNLANIDQSNVKYICEPSSNNLEAGTVVMPKMNYDYRVTLGKTTQPNLPFVEWAEKSAKCKMTKSCIRDLNKPRSWGGTHFYITGDNNLLMAKMHLGGCIAKVERIIKA